MSLALPWLVAPTAFGFCSSTVLVDYYGPSDVLEWPSYEPAGPDTILVVHRSGLGSVGALQILDPGGVEVPATRVDLAQQWVVLVPDAPLAVGDGYSLVTDTIYSPVSFDVADASGGDGDPARVPFRRETFSEVVRLDASCPDEAFTVHEVHYRLCGTSALMVAVVAETEPPTPTGVGDLGDVNGVGSGDLLDVTEGLSPGDSATVWLGTFDGAGRFRGWVEDPITVPEAGTIRLEEPIDDTIGSTSTPDTFAYVHCPSVPVEWITTFEQTCESWAPTGLECNDDDAQGSDVCGCTTGPNGAWGATVLLLLVSAACRTARCATGSSSASTTGPSGSR